MGAHARTVPAGRVSIPREVRAIRSSAASNAVPKLWSAAQCSFCIPTKLASSSQPRTCTSCWTAHLPGARVLAANLETAVNGVWDGRPHLGDRIAVIGAGTVGCLVAWLLSGIPGCDVELIDINPRRAEVARALKVQFAEPHTARPEADLVIDASGAPGGLDLALQVAAVEAKIVELSWFGDQTVPLPLGGAFHSKRLTIASSQVGHVAPSQRPRWDSRRRMQLVLGLLRNPALDVLITGESDFEALPDVMSTLARAPGDTLCHRIRYS